MKQGKHIAGACVWRTWWALSVFAILFYFVVGTHHHVGTHSCLAYEHLFFDASCAEGMPCGHAASGCALPVNSSHASHQAHACKCSVENISAVASDRIVVAKQCQSRDVPFWLAVAVVCLLLLFNCRNAFPPIGRSVRLFLPPLLPGHGLRAPPSFLY